MKLRATMSNQNIEQQQTPWAVIAVIVAIIITLVIYFSFIANDKEERVIVPELEVATVPDLEPVDSLVVEEVVEPIVPTIEDIPSIEPETVPTEPEVILPSLDNSDQWFTDKLPTLTWRKELIKLMITDDMIRRFVVFADNFSQGTLAYEHAPVISPATKFSAIEVKGQQAASWQWDENSTRRFSLYVDLLRSMDSEILIEWYVELKPLIDQAYQELGYPEDEFTDVLHLAIAKVLDMEILKDVPELERPSVMYRYKDPDIEGLDDAEKLLLRLGKDNLLVIKSVLLEINEKLARVSN